MDPYGGRLKGDGTMRFHGTLELNGKTATGVEVPAEVVDGLGGGKRAKVLVTLNGHTYRSSIATMGGRFMIGVNAAVREAAGVAAGDELEVGVELDTAPRTVDVPDDLAAALAAAGARAAFDALSYTRQRQYVEPVEGAKTEATRQRRITKCVTEVTP